MDVSLPPKGVKNKRRLTRQPDVLVLDLDEVPVLAELGSVEVSNRNTKLRQPNELLPVDTMRIGKDTTAIDNGDSLIRRQQNLV